MNTTLAASSAGLAALLISCKWLGKASPECVSGLLRGLFNPKPLVQKRLWPQTQQQHQATDCQHHLTCSAWSGAVLPTKLMMMRMMIQLELLHAECAASVIARGVCEYLSAVPSPPDLPCRTGTYDLRICCNGVLSGLVMVTSMCGFVDPWAAAVCGLIAGIVYPFVSHLLVSQQQPAAYCSCCDG
jgi:hypothetical protein